LTILALAATAVIAAASAAGAAPPERVVDGKPLSQWIDIVRTGDTQSSDWPKAVAALKASRERAIPLLLPLLDDKEGRVRVAAILLLTDRSPLTADVVSAFIKASAAPQTRMVALNGLGRPAASRKDVVPTLEAALKDPSHYIRATASRSLGNLGREGTPAVAALTAALADDKDLVRTAAQEALRKIRGQ
jgi:HEAT repeat protein